MTKHFFVIRSQARRRLAHAAGRLAQFVRDHPVRMITELRMLLLLPNVSKCDLRIREQVANGVNFRGVYCAALQTPHEMFCALFASPVSDQLIQLAFMRSPLVHRYETFICQPRRLFGCLTEPHPLRVIPTTDHAPLAIATWITTMRRCHWIPITVAVRDDAVRHVIKHCAADELDAGFELREIDVRAFARTSPMIQGREHGNAAKGHRDEIDI